jgi:signal peptidase I
MKFSEPKHTDVVTVSRMGGVRTYIEILFAVIFAAVVLKIFVVGVIHVPSHSMEGTIVCGDYVVVNKLIYGARSPKQIPFLTAGFPSFKMPGLRNVERGDVIVFEFPGSRQETYFVKRCIAVAGDTFSITNGNVVVNGKKYPASTGNTGADNIPPIQIPKAGDIIVLTDDNFSEYETIIKQEQHIIERLSENEFRIDGIKTNSYIVEQNYLYVLGDNRSRSYDSRAWGFLPEANVVGQANAVYWSLDPSVAIKSMADILNAIRWERIGKLIQ